MGTRVKPSCTLQLPAISRIAGGSRWAKVVELLSADDHTVVQFFRKRIPCSCLDEKYKEVKSVKKMGLCRNPNCSLPDHGRVERSKMFSCARCGNVNYCSVECQRAIAAEKKAALSTEQS